MRRKSDKAKRKEKYGIGHGADYKPYIRTSEFNSLGTCSNPIDWKTGRTVHLLSQGEKYFWYLMRWRDDVVDIREQFPLPVEKTSEIAEMYEIKHPMKGAQYVVMTSDFLVDYEDGTQEVFSIKNSKDDITESARTVEKLFIEKKYWESLEVPYHLVFKEDLNITFAENIRQTVQYYHLSEVFDSTSMIKYMIANKMLLIEDRMKENSLNFKELAKEYSDLIGFLDVKKIGE